MALQVSAPQLQGQLLEPSSAVLPGIKPQGAAVQLLLLQVLQQLQSIDPNRNQCTSLMNQLQSEKLRTRQERSRREDFEEEAYKEITKLRNEKKFTGINNDGIILELQVKKSKLESLEKQISEERNSRLNLEVEGEKCKVKLEQEQKLNNLLEKELKEEKEKCENGKEINKSLKEEIVKLESQLYEEKLLLLNVERRHGKDVKHIQQLEETLKNETMKRLSSEHEYLKQMLDCKNEISILKSLQGMAENSKKICDITQTNLLEEKDKVSKLKDELSDIRTDLFKLNVELEYEKKTVVELKEDLLKEVNNSKIYKNELINKSNKIHNLENEMKLIQQQLKDEKIQKDDLGKKLEAVKIDLSKHMDQVIKLKELSETEVERIKELEKKLETVNSTDKDLFEQNISLENKLQEAIVLLTKEKEKAKILEEKLENEENEIKDLKKNLKLESDIVEQEKDRRKYAEKELEIVKHLYVKCGEKDGLTPLHRACKVCDISEAQSLMRNNYSANEATKGNSTWKTSVHLAVQSGCIDLVHLFAINETLINIWDENGATPLHEAARFPNINIIRVLLDNGAAINAWDKFGKTPLDYAGNNSNKEVMKFLIDRGAVLGSVREFGPTPTIDVNDVDISDYEYNYHY